MKKKMKPMEKPRFNSAGYQISLKDLNGEPLPILETLSFQPSVMAGRGPAPGASRRDASPFSLGLVRGWLQGSARMPSETTKRYPPALRAIWGGETLNS
jgi:hypothetical protein